MGLFAIKEKLLGYKVGDGGDFNDLRDHGEKQGERRRQEGSFLGFRNFIVGIEMGEVKFRGIRLLGPIIEKGKALL